MTEVDRSAKIIWDYMLMHHALKSADAIFVLGSNDTRVAERAAELYRTGLAPVVIFSGGNGKGSVFDKPEAEVFAAVAEAYGVPRSQMILETASSNTGENVLFTKALLAERGLDFKTFMLVQKPYMERRAYATFRKQWPDAECTVTSPQLSYETYASDEHYAGRWLDVMVGDLQRIKEYPAKGFQIEQDIPAEVWEAYEHLVALGYTKYVMKD